MKTPPHAMPHIVAVIFSDLMLLWAGWMTLRFVWWELGRRYWQRRRDREQQMLLSGMDYVAKLSPGPARTSANNNLGDALHRFNNWPEDWECLAWATTKEIERELERRRRA